MGALDSARDLMKAWREEGAASKVAWTSVKRWEATLDSGAKDFGVCLLRVAALFIDFNGDTFSGLAGDILTS